MRLKKERLTLLYEIDGSISRLSLQLKIVGFCMEFWIQVLEAVKDLDDCSGHKMLQRFYTSFIKVFRSCDSLKVVIENIRKGKNFQMSQYL